MREKEDVVGIDTMEENVTPTKRSFEPFVVKVDIPNLRKRKTPFPNGEPHAAPVSVGTYTIVDVRGDYGLLKSHKENRDGWINLKYVKRV